MPSSVALRDLGHAFLGKRPQRSLHLGLALALTCYSCSGRRADAALQREAGALVQAVAGLRQATNPEKSAHLRQLEQTPCTQEDTCAFKGRCSDAYRKFLAAVGEIANLETAFPAAGVFDPQKFAAVEQDLDEARKKTLACAEVQGELQRRYQLAR